MMLPTEALACSLSATDNQTVSLQDYRGQWIVLYFYPKDATPGCTLEAQQFRDQYPAFQALNAIIIGVSRDDIRSHERFKQKEQLPFTLLADTQEDLCNQFDVLKLKSLYGKQVRGIERATFLIDPEGIVQFEWRNVTVKDHVAAVYEKLVALHTR